MNPGYNLWDKYFIANICLYILCQCVLKLLQMNVKRKVSEQAAEGTKQRCSSAGRRREDSQEGKTEQQTIFLGSSQIKNVVWRTSPFCSCHIGKQNLEKEVGGGRGDNRGGCICVLLCFPPSAPTVGATPQLGRYSHSSIAYPRTLSMKCYWAVTQKELSNF